MNALRTITCPACGKTHLLGQRCPCGGRARTTPTRRRAADAVAQFAIVFLFTLAGIVAIALAVGHAKGSGFGIAVAVGAWLALHALRLGYDWDDGIDIRMLVFPGPIDWPTKLRSLANLFTAPRSRFRAAYLAGFVALVVVIAVLGPSLVSGKGGAPASPSGRGATQPAP